MEVALSRLWAPGFSCSADPSYLVYIVYSTLLVFESSLFLFVYFSGGTKAQTHILRKVILIVLSILLVVCFVGTGFVTWRLCHHLYAKQQNTNEDKHEDIEMFEENNAANISRENETPLYSGLCFVTSADSHYHETQRYKSLSNETLDASHLGKKEYQAYEETGQVRTRVRILQWSLLRLERLVTSKHSLHTQLLRCPDKLGTFPEEGLGRKGKGGRVGRNRRIDSRVILPYCCTLLQALPGKN